MSKKAKFLSLVLLIITFIFTDVGAHPSKRTTIKPNGQGSALSAPQTKFDLFEHDRDNTERLTSIFITRMFGIKRASINLQSADAAQWKQRAGYYRELSQTADKLYALSPDVSSVKTFMLAEKLYYQEIAQISDTIETSKLPLPYQRAFFAAIVEGRQVGFPVDSKNKPAVAKILGLRNRSVDALNRATQSFRADMLKYYKVGIDDLLDNPNAKIPFETAFEQSGNETDYIYDFFIKDSNLAPELSSLFKGNLERFLSLLYTESLYNTAEIGFLFGDLGVNNPRSPLPGRLKFIVGTALDCAALAVATGKNKRYREANDLHKAIISKFEQNGANFPLLVELAKAESKTLPKSLIPLGAKYQELITLTDFYMKQREKILVYLKKGERLTGNLLIAASNDKSELLDESILAMADIYLSKNRKKEIFNQGVEIGLGKPCEIFRDVFQKLNKGR